VSQDNLVWDDSVVSFVTVQFNPAASRYEIEFAPVSTRYIKVVNSGVNSVPGVNVTEIEAFEARDQIGEISESRSSHYADARIGWQVNRRWFASLDMSGRIEPHTGSVSQRLDYDYSLRARYQPTRTLAHTFTWSQSWQQFEGTTSDLRSDGATYSLLYDPLPTLGGSFSAALRQNTEAGEASLRSASGTFAANATPWPAVRASADLGASRVDQPRVDYLVDSWNFRFSLESDITRSLRASVAWRHQESWAGDDREHRVLRGLALSGELQFTNTVFGRASVIFNDDRTFSRSENYLLSWWLLARLAITGQYNSDQTEGSFGSERWSVGASLDAFDRLFGLRNVTIYVQFSDVNQETDLGSNILSWQQGVRATF
jgi:hypothetical protein